jgi:hypothetical protein
VSVDGQVVRVLNLPRQALLDAIDWIEFVLSSWACLEGGTPLARSQRERAVIDCADRVIAYVDSRGVPVLGSLLLDNHVGGLRTPDQEHEVLDMIEDMYPGTVTTVAARGTRGGRPGRLVHPRPRRDPSTSHADLAPRAASWQIEDADLGPKSELYRQGDADLGSKSGLDRPPDSVDLGERESFANLKTAAEDDAGIFLYARARVKKKSEPPAEQVEDSYRGEL